VHALSRRRCRIYSIYIRCIYIYIHICSRICYRTRTKRRSSRKQRNKAPTLAYAQHNTLCPRLVPALFEGCVHPRCRIIYARRMGQPTQRATNYTARSNIDTAHIFLHANGQRPRRAMIRQRSRRRQRRGEPHTEHGPSESFSLFIFIFIFIYIEIDTYRYGYVQPQSVSCTVRRLRTRRAAAGSVFIYSLALSFLFSSK